MANGTKKDPLLEDEDAAFAAPPPTRSLGAKSVDYVDPTLFADENPYAALSFGAVPTASNAAVAGMPAEPMGFDYAGFMKSKQRGYSFESPGQKGQPGGAAGRTSRTARGGGGGGGGGFDTPAAIGALAGLAGSVGQYYGAVKKMGETSQDVLNQQRLTELRAKEAELRRGQPTAQDIQELALLESAQMNPVRALATQQMQRGEAERASMGATRAARQALESERIGRQQVTQAAQQVGLQKAQRALQQRAEKKAELARTQREIDERTAYESGVERNRLAFIGESISGVMGLAGKALGGYIPELAGPSADQRADFRRMYPEFATLPDSTVDAAIEGLTAARKG